MSIIKKDYLANTMGLKSFTLGSLSGIPGIYMITNKVTKKFYIGMSTNLKNRLEDYLNIEWLMRNRSSRIHKALLKYGFDNFSVTILQFDLDKSDTSSAFWREREDFFIKAFKPQYNIKKSRFNTTWDITANKSVKITKDLPITVKNNLDLSLDPNNLKYHLMMFNFLPKKRSYVFVIITPKGLFRANSYGWHLGDIKKNIGWEKLSLKTLKDIKINTVLTYSSTIEKDRLCNLYPPKDKRSIKNKLNLKIKALKTLSSSGYISLSSIGVIGKRTFSTSTKNMQRVQPANSSRKQNGKSIQDKNYFFKNQKTFTLDLKNRHIKNSFLDFRKDRKRLKRPDRIIILKFNSDYVQLIRVATKDNTSGFLKKVFKKLKTFAVKHFFKSLTLLYLIVIYLIIVISYSFHYTLELEEEALTEYNEVNNKDETKNNDEDMINYPQDNLNYIQDTFGYIDDKTNQGQPEDKKVKPNNTLHDHFNKLGERFSDYQYNYSKYTENSTPEGQIVDSLKEFYNNDNNSDSSVVTVVRIKDTDSSSTTSQGSKENISDYYSLFKKRFSDDIETKSIEGAGISTDSSCSTDSDDTIKGIPSMDSNKMLNREDSKKAWNDIHKRYGTDLINFMRDNIDLEKQNLENAKNPEEIEKATRLIKAAKESERRLLIEVEQYSNNRNN